MELLKAAGFNAIRSAHNPLSRAMLDACDRLGVLVMDETFDIWAQTKTADDYALRFDGLVGGRRRGDGPQGRQPPERRPLLHRQRDPRRLHADRPAAQPGPGREGPVPSTPPGS